MNNYYWIRLLNVKCSEQNFDTGSGFSIFVPHSWRFPVCFRRYLLKISPTFVEDSRILPTMLGS